MLYEELTASVEQAGQRDLAFWRVEDILFSTFTHGSSRRWLPSFIAPPRELFFFRQ